MAKGNISQPGGLGSTRSNAAGGGRVNVSRPGPGTVGVPPGTNRGTPISPKSIPQPIRNRIFPRGKD
jgi:hypothetical protein